MDNNEHSIVRQRVELEKRRSQLAKRGLELISTLDSRPNPDLIYIADEECKLISHWLNALKQRIDIESVDSKYTATGELGQISGRDISKSLRNHGINFESSPFDPYEYSRIFRTAKIAGNGILHWVYAFDGNNGQPLLYFSETEQDISIETPERYFQFFDIPKESVLWGRDPTPQTSAPYLRGLKFEKSPLGYFHFALFCMTVRQFFLLGEARRNGRRFLLTEEDIQYCINENFRGLPNMKSLALEDWKPKIIIKGDRAECVVLCLEQIGLSRLHIYVRYPNIFEGIKSDVIQRFGG